MDAKTIARILQSCCAKDDTRHNLRKPIVRCRRIGYDNAYATDGVVAVEINLGQIKPEELGIQLHLTKENTFYENIADTIARHLDTLAVSCVRSTVSVGDLSDFCGRLIERVHRERGEFEREEDDPDDFEPVDTAYIYGRIRIDGVMFNVTRLVTAIEALKSADVDQCEISLNTDKIGFYGDGIRCVCMGMNCPDGCNFSGLIIEEYFTKEGR